jgi:starch phosphorylase
VLKVKSAYVMHEEAGEDNNYIFGARVEDIERERKTYEPKVFYEANPRVKRVVDTLIDNTVQDEGTGMFKELYDSLLVGASWHIADNYYLLPDLIALTEARLRANRDYKDILGFGKKCMINTCNAGKFSSDRTIQEYWKEIWLK